jgi:hypothetical protein
MRSSTFFAPVAIILATVIVYLILVIIGFRQRASEIPSRRIAGTGVLSTGEGR